MIRRTASAEIAAATAAESGETALGRFLIKMPSGMAPTRRQLMDKGPFLCGAALPGLAFFKCGHGYRIRRKARTKA